jgi:hypothetical protein
VQIKNVAIDKVLLLDALGGTVTSNEELLTIQLTINTTNPTKKLEYHSWMGENRSSQNHATVTDEFGNVYDRIDFGILDHVIGSVKTKAIYPGNSVTDILVFQKPIASATEIDLELPGANCGQDGLIRFRTPLNIVKGSEFDKRDKEATRLAEVAKQQELLRKQADEERKANEAHQRNLAEIQATKETLLLKRAEDQRKAEEARLEARQNEITKLREVLKNAEVDQARIYQQSQEADRAAFDAKNKAVVDMATSKALANDLERAVGESKEKDALRKKYLDARQQAIDSKKRAEELAFAAKQAADNVKQASAAATSAGAALKQALR